MCGIVGYLDKSGASTRLGPVLLTMLGALDRRGPDSAGVAVWGAPSDGMIVRIAMHGGVLRAAAAPLGHDRSGTPARAREIVKRAQSVGRVTKVTTQGPYVRFEIAMDSRAAARSTGEVSLRKGDPRELARALEIDRDVEIVSMGTRLEIVKEVGAPGNLDAEFGVSKLAGSHAIGHTRLSTESRVDLSHSQPFWAHGVPDLAIVHNGHITNYHRLRRIYEQDGVRFHTENDSEVIGVYLARKLRAGLTFREALAASVNELDGSFSYLAATASEFGFARDLYALKPLIVAESPATVAIANEEVALHAVLGRGYQAGEVGAGEVMTWNVPSGATRKGRAA